jgi:hypothetical protein
MGCSNGKTKGKRKTNLDDNAKGLIAEKKFLKLNSDVKTALNVNLCNLLLESDTYYSLLTTLAGNHIVETFKMDNLEIQNTDSKRKIVSYLDHYGMFIALANSLKGKPSLKSIELISLNNIGPKAGTSIAVILQKCPNVEKLILKEIELDEKDADPIGKVLKHNSKNLKHFEFSGIFFEELDKIFDGLKENESIEVLILNKINLNPEFMDTFLPAVESNINLRLLDVSNNPLKNSVKSFGEFFANYYQLNEIKLNNCDINDDNLRDLLHSLKSNTSVKVLELNNNEISKHSMENIQAFFDLNKTLEYLYLLKNKIRRQDLEILDNNDLIKIISEI